MSRIQKSYVAVAALFLALSITGCSGENIVESYNESEGITDIKTNDQTEDSILEEPNEVSDYTVSNNNLPKGEYREGVVLTKTNNNVDFNKFDLAIESIEDMCGGWKIINLSAGTTKDAIDYLSATNLFEKVEYDYVLSQTGDGNDSEKFNYIEELGLDDPAINGGDSSVVVAVIDTGVDYNHIDLRDNIWTNNGEIPNNGIDDDGNGYIDDYRGWNFCNNSRDPMDDNGHGTHVAGIIAAARNNIGMYGVAYNCKIMALKAGTADGVFSMSNVSKALYYAAANGASIINMSLGGYTYSSVMHDAIKEAYKTTVLVAAAGNDQLSISDAPCFPAALPEVIGVMSCSDQNTPSAFSNYDRGHSPTDIDIGYDVYCYGERVYSTFPNNRYAYLTGTSMASPLVAGVAAILRSSQLDREILPNKYIYAQIISTGNIFPDHSHSIINLYRCLTCVPKPDLRFSGCSFFDNLAYSENNNANGLINPGETIRLSLELFNKGGRSSDISVTFACTNYSPLITFTKPTTDFSDVGTYSTMDSGGTYQNGKLIDPEKYVEFTVSQSAPNDYLIYLDIQVAYKNGFDPDDHGTYNIHLSHELYVYKGRTISGSIVTDTTFDNSEAYIISESISIKENVTVTFEEGCIITYVYNKAGDSATIEAAHQINIYCYGTLYFNGTSSNRIIINQQDDGINWSAGIKTVSNGKIYMEYCDCYNGDLSITEARECYFSKTDTTYSDGKIAITNNLYAYIRLIASNLFQNCCAYKINHITAKTINGCYINCSQPYISANDFTNNYVWLFTVGSGTPGGISISNVFTNNIIDSKNDQAFKKKVGMGFSGSIDNIYGNIFRGNVLETISASFGNGFYFPDGESIIDKSNKVPLDDSLLWPHISSIQFFDSNNEETTSLSIGTMKIRLTFNVDMNIDSKLSVWYGSRYAAPLDYELKGDFVDSRTWEGYSTIRLIESSIMHLSISGGYDTGWKPLVESSFETTFTIDTTETFAMSLQANPTDEGIELTWYQDDYETLMGYNIYRSTSRDGNYSKINTSVIPASENTFIDDSCEPGATYWYTFTVVLTDFTESAPAGKVCAVAKDTIAPTIYHTPVNQGYINNNLTIFCTVSDNIGVQSATLYYRIVNSGVWKTIEMTKNSNRFSATIYGNEVTAEGLEYYISVTDGTNTVTRGSAESPYVVVVKDPTLLNDLGDVDGDGVITTKDALMIIRAINDELILTDDQFQRADLNKNHVLETMEALRILQYINGNVTSLEM